MCTYIYYSEYRRLANEDRPESEIKPNKQSSAQQNDSKTVSEPQELEARLLKRNEDNYYELEIHNMQEDKEIISQNKGASISELQSVESTCSSAPFYKKVGHPKETFKTSAGYKIKGVSTMPCRWGSSEAAARFHDLSATYEYIDIHAYEQIPDIQPKLKLMPKSSSCREVVRGHETEQTNHTPSRPTSAVTPSMKGKHFSADKTKSKWWFQLKKNRHRAPSSKVINHATKYEFCPHFGQSDATIPSVKVAQLCADKQPRGWLQPKHRAQSPQHPTTTDGGEEPCSDVISQTDIQHSNTSLTEKIHQPYPTVYKHIHKGTVPVKSKWPSTKSIKPKKFHKWCEHRAPPVIKVVQLSTMTSRKEDPYSQVQHGKTSLSEKMHETKPTAYRQEDMSLGKSKQPSASNNFKSKEKLRKQYKHRPPPPKVLQYPALTSSKEEPCSQTDSGTTPCEKMHQTNSNACKEVNTSEKTTQTSAKSKKELHKQYKHRAPSKKMHQTDSNACKEVDTLSEKSMQPLANNVKPKEEFHKQYKHRAPSLKSLQHPIMKSTSVEICFNAQHNDTSLLEKLYHTNPTTHKRDLLSQKSKQPSTKSAKSKKEELRKQYKHRAPPPKPYTDVQHTSPSDHLSTVASKQECTLPEKSRQPSNDDVIPKEELNEQRKYRALPHNTSALCNDEEVQSGHFSTHEDKHQSKDSIQSLPPNARVSGTGEHSSNHEGDYMPLLPPKNGKL